MEFQKSETYLNLARSFAGEAQAGLRYQFIADQCTAQGYHELAKEIRTLAKNETFHAKQFFEKIIEKCGCVCVNVVIILKFLQPIYMTALFAAVADALGEKVMVKRPLEKF